MSRLNKLYDFFDSINSSVFSMITNEETFKSQNKVNNQEQEWKTESLLNNEIKSETKAAVKGYISMYNG